MGNSEIIGNLTISKNGNFEIIEKLSISENASNFSQTNFCTFSQQTVIKKDPVVPSNDANLSWFNTDILAKN